MNPKNAARLVAVLALASTAATGAVAGDKTPPKPPFDLPAEHLHPSGAFRFRTPAAWQTSTPEGMPDVFQAKGDGLIVRFVFKPQEIGLDGWHVTCMDIRLLGPMETSPQVKYEYDFVGGILGNRKLLDSAFVVRYEKPVDGQVEWRQRNLTVVGEGESLCAIGYAPTSLVKKGDAKRLLDAVITSVRFEHTMPSSPPPSR